MKKTFAAAALALSLASHGSEEAMQQAMSHWNQQVKEYETALQNAPNDEVKESLTAPDAREAAPKIWQAINGRTGSRKAGKNRVPTFEFEEPWALPAIVWILEHPQAFTAAFTDDEQAQLTYFGNALVESLINVHFNAPGIGAACPALSATSSVREYELLQKIYHRNQNKGARACAALGMSLMLNNPMVSSIEGSESMARAKRLYYLKQSILLSEKDTKFGNTPVTTVAMEQAYFLRHLAPGCIAPQLKLSEPGGPTAIFPVKDKLNLLIFWSPANSASCAMVRDIEKIRSQYPGIEIFPIMPHADEESRSQALEALGIPHSYTDNAQGSAGKTYRIAQLPTAILVSKNSTILYGGYPDMKLQAALEKASAPEKAARPKVIIKEEPDTPVLQPGSTPTPKQDDSVPALREMPEF